MPWDSKPSHHHLTSRFVLPLVSLHSVWTIGIFWPLELHFESLHANLEAIHSLDSCLGAGWVVKTHKSWKRDKRVVQVTFHLYSGDILPSQATFLCFSFALLLLYKAYSPFHESHQSICSGWWHGPQTPWPIWHCQRAGTSAASQSH